MAIAFIAFTRWVTAGRVSGSGPMGAHSCRKMMAGEREANSERRALIDP